MYMITKKWKNIQKEMEYEEQENAKEKKLEETEQRT